MAGPVDHAAEYAVKMACMDHAVTGKSFYAVSGRQLLVRAIRYGIRRWFQKP
jgi:hypothetical protein